MNIMQIEKGVLKSLLHYLVNLDNISVDISSWISWIKIMMIHVCLAKTLQYISVLDAIK